MRARVRRGLASALVAAAVGALASGCPALSERAAIERVIEAYGSRSKGADAGFEQEGRIVSPLHPGVVGTVVRKSDGPTRLRVETSFPGQGAEVRIVDGERGWRDGVEVGGPNLAAMQLQAARLALPQLLAARRAEVADRGEVTSAGARRHVLTLALGQGRELTLEVDPDSGRVTRTIGRSVSAGGGLTIEFATDYGEFRSVSGRLFPFYECTTAMGRRTADITFGSTVLVQAFPPGTFAP